jgi:RNA polymerase sigma factor (sigma-70 family)
MTARLRLPARLPELLSDDRTLLARFIERRDDTAFASIVKRHGGFVLGVCRRVVRNAALAEDAFQAVFLVLARNPRAAAKASSVAGWLFGTARRVSLAARRSELRRMNRELGAAALPKSNAAGEWDELLLAVDEELAKLPEENRAALIACFLREQTQDEAARELGWSLSTLRRRLEHGKELLRARLTRRGTTLSAGLFAGMLAPSSAMAVPRELLAKAGRECAASSTALELAARGTVAKLPLAVVGVLVAAVMVGAMSPRSAAEAEPPADAPLPREVARESKPEWITITGQVVFPADKDIPERREILKTDGFVKDAECCFDCGRRLHFENLMIDPKSRGIANAVVWLRPDSEHPKAAMPPEKIHGKHEPKERIVEVKDCQFVPRITAARAGDTLRFKNPAPLATNVKYETSERGPGAKFGEFNVLLAAKTGSIVAPGPLVRGTAADRFSSTIYPWMKGSVWTFDHPYFAVTDTDGKFTIPDAPVGMWRLVIWHEEYGYSGGTFSGKRMVLQNDTKLNALPFSIRR